MPQFDRMMIPIFRNSRQSCGLGITKHFQLTIKPGQNNINTHLY
jgi:hypothetical protein